MKRFLTNALTKLVNGIRWLMVLPFGLLLYIGAKGCAYLIASRYEGSGSLVPILTDLLIGGIVSVSLILLLTYALAPRSKTAAAAGVGLLCVAFNGYFEVWRSFNGMTENPLWQAAVLTALSLLASLVTWNELRSFRRRKEARAQALSAESAAENARSS